MLPKNDGRLTSKIGGEVGPQNRWEMVDRPPKQVGGRDPCHTPLIVTAAHMEDVLHS